MENIQAYTTNNLSIPVRQQSGNIDPARQNQQVPAQDTDITQETSHPVQQAFDVQISSQALEQANVAASDNTENTEIQSTVSPASQPAGQSYTGNAGRGSIVDIVT